MSNEAAPEGGASWKAVVFDRELAALKKAGRQNAARTLTGICLSGGGVRSAVVCSGILGLFAQRGLLSHFDYLSTVSGGGYAGGAQSFFAFHRAGRAAPSEPDTVGSRPKDPDDPSDDPAASDKPDADAETDADAACPFNFASAQNAFLEENAAYRRHLRANISYLMPTGFRGLIAGSYVVVRSILLNIVIWVLLIAVALELAGLLGGVPSRNERSAGAGLSADWWHSLAALVPRWSPPATPAHVPFYALGYLGTACLILALLLMPVFSFLTIFKAVPNGETGRRALWPGIRAFFGYPWRRVNEWLSARLIALGLALLVFGGLPWMMGHLDMLTGWLEGTPPPEKAPEDDRIAIYRALIATGAALVDTPYLEMLARWVEGGGAARTGQGAAPDAGDGHGGLIAAFSALVATAFALYAFVRQQFGEVFSRFRATLIVLACALLVYAVLILAFEVSRSYSTSLTLALGTGAFALAWFCNVNDVSLGRFYRDRLMETFTPDRATLTPEPAAADGWVPLAHTGRAARSADTLRLEQLPEAGRPIHLINTNVMTWWSRDTRARRRMGDNFVLSGHGCGSDTTGWKPIADVAIGKLTLPTAIAASGAAVNPQGGLAGRGPTTSLPVTVAMGLLSLRLGYWLRWGAGDWMPALDLPRVLRIPTRWGNRIKPSALSLIQLIWMKLWGLRGRKSDNVPAFIELTDGGHFENLGLYELVRRRCKLIVVCDGGDDRETAYEGFASAIRRIREDFGAEIHFDMIVANGPDGARVSGPQDLVARPRENQYPLGADYASKGYFLASIEYGQNPGRPGRDGYRADSDTGPERGIIIYLKSALIENVAITTKGYRGVNENFPYDTTVNQFFTPEQFEAYRDLGEKVAEQMVDDLGLDPARLNWMLGDGERLLDNASFRRRGEARTAGT